jgi:hypothetical protein
MEHPLEYVIVFAIFVLLFVSGCGQIKVEGKVIFPDGTPLSAGKVVFENATDAFTGNIQEDGTFRLGVYKDGQGIPAGKYRVAISSAFEKLVSNNAAIQKPTKDNLPKIKKRRTIQRSNKAPEFKFLVAEKYRSVATSGIEYDIQKNTKNISIVVEKP